MRLSRKEFVLASLGLAAAAVAGCGGGEGEPPPRPPPPSPTPTGDAGTGSSDAGSGTPDAGTGTPDAGTQSACLENGTTDEISANHGHELTVSREDVAAGAEKTYDITGVADHGHTVTVTAQQFAQLAEDSGISITSSTSLSHNHNVTIRCA